MVLRHGHLLQTMQGLRQQGTPAKIKVVHNRQVRPCRPNVAAHARSTESRLGHKKVAQECR